VTFTGGTSAGGTSRFRFGIITITASITSETRMITILAVLRRPLGIDNLVLGDCSLIGFI
jgi:hypothetical protein